MVEYTLDTIFRSLGNNTRRDILLRVYEGEQTITELAAKYKMTFAAIAKHVDVLEKSKLVRKRKRGKEQVISINSASFEEANEYLQNYARLWSGRLDSLEKMLQEEDSEKHNSN